ncbi:MAG: DUF1345 domain-containing protein [Actinomycetes bacterium]
MPTSDWMQARTKVVIALAAGVLAAVALWWLAPTELSVLVGWDVACLVFLGSVWPVIRPFDGAATAQHAQHEDPTKAFAHLLLLGAAVGSLVAVGFVLVRAGHSTGTARALLIGLSVASVAVSWCVVHTVFTLRYADLYYRGSEGVEFNQDAPPSYLDFAYLAFTVGMTFQVSDTSIKDSEIRRAVLAQALLSYLFGTGILATAINLVAGLI